MLDLPGVVVVFWIYSWEESFLTPSNCTLMLCRLFCVLLFEPRNLEDRISLYTGRSCISSPVALGWKSSCSEWCCFQSFWPTWVWRVGSYSIWSKSQRLADFSRLDYKAFYVEHESYIKEDYVPLFEDSHPTFHDHYHVSKILEGAFSRPPLLVNYVEEHFYITSSVCSSHIPIYCPKWAV